MIGTAADVGRARRVALGASVEFAAQRPCVDDRRVAADLRAYADACTWPDGASAGRWWLAWRRRFV